MGRLSQGDAGEEVSGLGWVWVRCKVDIVAVTRLFELNKRATRPAVIDHVEASRLSEALIALIVLSLALLLSKFRPLLFCECRLLVFPTPRRSCTSSLHRFTRSPIHPRRCEVSTNVNSAGRATSWSDAFVGIVLKLLRLEPALQLERTMTLASKLARRGCFWKSSGFHRFSLCPGRFSRQQPGAAHRTRTPSRSLDFFFRPGWHRVAALVGDPFARR